ncbi:hypothetical protein C6497_00165 [Candidatus Poribacteria bacterium]|nr:MAG: hypothetical protein C6497_00165 [Candidatus Poribacteria bacterium]
MERDRRVGNLKLGLALGLLFIVLFAFATFWIILQVDVPPIIKTVVSWVTYIVAGSIGIYLIGSSIIMLITAIVKTIILKIKRLTKKDESY